MTSIIRVRVDPTSYASATRRILDWASLAEGRYVCAANVHMLMEAYNNQEFGKVVNSADMVTPDGMPLVCMMRLKGIKGQSRVYGPTLMLHVLEMASCEHVPVGFYGSKRETLGRLVNNCKMRFPALRIAYAYSPPYRALGQQEAKQIIEKINASGTRILFVGLGCPKQEIWMAEHRRKVNAVMLGVGAAFDFHAGVKSQAPQWMQKAGLEWFFRLCTEPRRLWRRYLYHNPRFIFLAIADLLGFIR